MSSNKNDESDNNGIALAAAFIGAVVMVLVFAVFAVLAFVTFLLTILAVWAWNKPRRIGRVAIEPGDARAFVWRGLIGAGVLPFFIAFMSIFFSIPINWDYLPYFVATGYIFGSLVLDIIFTMESEDGTPSAPASAASRAPQIQTPRRALPRHEQKEEFRFASWDDEEDRP